MEIEEFCHCGDDSVGNGPTKTKRRKDDYSARASRAGALFDDDDDDDDEERQETDFSDSETEVSSISPSNTESTDGDRASSGRREPPVESEKNKEAAPKIEPRKSASSSKHKRRIALGKSDRNIMENPTSLYLMIQNRKWEEALEQMKHHRKEAGTWSYRKCDKGRLIWRLLPLHAAIILEAPNVIIETLLAMYPLGAQSTDDQGMLPIHLAFRAGLSEKMIDLLLLAYPKAANVQDFKGRLPLDLAQASAAPHKDGFLRALQRGPSYYTNAELATARAAAMAKAEEQQQEIFNAKWEAAVKAQQQEIENIRAEAEQKQQELIEKRVIAVEDQRTIFKNQLGEIDKAHKQELKRVKQEGMETQQKLMEKIATIEVAELASKLKEAAEEHEREIEQIKVDSLKNQQELIERERTAAVETERALFDKKTNDLEKRLLKEIETIKKEAAENEQKLEQSLKDQRSLFNLEVESIETKTSEKQQEFIEKERAAAAEAQRALYEAKTRELEEAHNKAIKTIKNEALEKEKKLQQSILEQRSSYELKMKDAHETQAQHIEVVQAENLDKKIVEREEAHLIEIEMIKAEAAEKQHQSVQAAVALQQDAFTAMMKEMEEAHKNEMDSIRKEASMAQEKVKPLETDKANASKEQEDKEQEDIVAMLVKTGIEEGQRDFACRMEEIEEAHKKEIGIIRAEAAKEQQKLKSILQEQRSVLGVKVMDAAETHKEQIEVELGIKLQGVEKAYQRELDTIKLVASESVEFTASLDTKLKEAKEAHKAALSAAIKTADENKELKSHLSSMLATEKDSARVLKETMDLLEQREQEWSEAKKDLTSKISDSEVTAASSKAQGALLTAQLKKTTGEFQKMTELYGKREKELTEINKTLLDKVCFAQTELASEKARSSLLNAELRNQREDEGSLVICVNAEKALNKNLTNELKKKENVEKMADSLNMQVKLLMNDLTHVNSKLKRKDEEEKLMAARLDKMLSTEDNLNNQIKLLVSKLNEVKEEGEKAESYMTRQIETLKNEKNALQGTIMVLTKSMNNNDSSEQGSLFNGSRNHSSTKRRDALED